MKRNITNLVFVKEFNAFKGMLHKVSATLNKGVISTSYLCEAASQLGAALVTYNRADCPIKQTAISICFLHLANIDDEIALIAEVTLQRSALWVMKVEATVKEKTIAKGCVKFMEAK